MSTKSINDTASLLTFEEAWKRLNISRTQFLRLTGKGLIPTVRISERCRRVRTTALENFINSRTVG